MVQSKQVLEWQRQARIENSRAYIRRILELRFGPLPEALVRRLQGLSDVERLDALLDEAVQKDTLQDVNLE